MTDISQDFARPRVGDRFGPYRLLHELGAGSSGVVYLAELADDGQATPSVVALKVLRPLLRQRPRRATAFARIAELAARFAVPNVCPVLGSGMHGEVPYLVMRYLEGRTLAQDLQENRRQRLPRRIAHNVLLRQFEKLALALHQLHTRRLTHRDVKPSNVILDRDGEPWLIDCCMMLEGDDTAATLAGSLAYLAPELLGGVGRPGPASDLYALGVTLFEAATGRRPWLGTTAPQLLQEMWSARRPKAHQLERTLPTDLDVVLDRLLQREPTHRYPDGAALADDLRRVRERLPLATPRDPLPTRVLRWVQRHPLATAALAPLGAALLGLGWWSIHSERALRMTDLLASGSVVAAAEQTGRSLLPAARRGLPAVLSWLAEHDGPRGLRARLDRVRTALADLDATRAPRRGTATPTTRDELEAELHAVEGLPRLAHALRHDATLAAILAPLLPALERHQQALTNRLDAQPAAVAPTMHPPTADGPPLVQQLHEVERVLAQATGPDGIVARMRSERDALLRIDTAFREDADAWRRACAEVDAAPEYRAARDHGFGLQPVEGLHPLGPDPHSRLQEFACLRSGRAPIRGPNGNLELDESCALVFVLLPGGPFTMGTSVQDDPLAGYEEEPGLPIELAPFLLAKHELSQAQWRRLGGDATFILQPGDQIDAVTIQARHPAEGMSFAMAESVLQAHGLVLPTEAQWEYAARRGGVASPFAGHANLRPNDDGHPLSHAPVGSFAADRSGLHDLHGNVPEMVADPFGTYDLYPPREGDGRRCSWRLERVARGGGFYNTAKEARATARTAMPDLGPLPFVGIRPAMAILRR